MKKTVRHYLDDIANSINDIENFVEGCTEESLADNIMLRSALVYKIQVIGEIIKRLPEIYLSKYPKIPWKEIAGMRDKIVHDYDGIDYETVWQVVAKDIPELKIIINKLINDVEMHTYQEKD